MKLKLAILMPSGELLVYNRQKHTFLLQRTIVLKKLLYSRSEVKNLELLVNMFTIPLHIQQDLTIYLKFRLGDENLFDMRSYYLTGPSNVNIQYSRIHFKPIRRILFLILNPFLHLVLSIP